MFTLKKSLIINIKIMSKIDFTIEEKDLKVLFIHAKDAYKGYSFEMFKKECKEVYENEYLKNRENPKTFSQWINGQIITLTTPF